jgi:hypothetical protein
MFSCPASCQQQCNITVLRAESIVALITVNLALAGISSALCAPSLLHIYNALGNTRQHVPMPNTLLSRPLAKQTKRLSSKQRMPTP